MKIIKVFFLGMLICSIGWTQSNILNTFSEMPAGFKHQILLNPVDNTPQAHLITMESDGQSKVSFVSRARFKGDFNYQSIEEHYRQQGQQIVLQVAAAFTPDWKIIEGFALQEGKKVGQDSLLGENNNLPYKGVLCIKQNQPFFCHLDSIKERRVFTEKAIAGKWSLFLQAAPIVNGQLDTTLILPGIHKRRFFVETAGKMSQFAVLDFINKTSYLEAVMIMKNLKNQGIIIKNAVYLDMGSVSEGYVYDKGSNKYLIGNSNTFMNKYTNMLVIYIE